MKVPAVKKAIKNKTKKGPMVLVPNRKFSVFLFNRKNPTKKDKITTKKFKTKLMIFIMKNTIFSYINPSAKNFEYFFKESQYEQLNIAE